jgi:hypothetical protein
VFHPPDFRTGRRARDVFARECWSLVLLDGACILVRVSLSKAWGLHLTVFTLAPARRTLITGENDQSRVFYTSFERRRLSESREHRRPGSVGGRFFFKHFHRCCFVSFPVYSFSTIFPHQDLSYFFLFLISISNRCAAQTRTLENLLADKRPDLQAYENAVSFLLTFIHCQCLNVTRK